MKDFLERLKDVDYRVRRDAVRSLKGKPVEGSITLLIEAMGDENEVVAREAVEVLGSFGEDILPFMIKALKNTNWRVRRNAAKVLVSLGNEYLEVLLDLAKSNDDDIQFWIFEVISQFGTQAVPTLVEIIDSDETPTRLCAISALGRTGVKEAVAPLIQSLSSSQWTIRKAAAGALVAVGRCCVDEVVKLAEGQDEDSQFWAIQILGEVGGDKAKKCLIKKMLSDDTNLDQKQSLIQSLRNFDSEDVVPPLTQMLGDSNWFVRKQSAEALWELGDLAEGHLGKALKSKNSDIRYWAARVLGELQSVDWVSSLTEILRNDDSWSVRAAAAQALGEIGDDSVTLDLVDALRDSSEYVKKNSLIALNKIGEVKEARDSFNEEWVQEFTREVFSNLKSKRTKSILARIKAGVVDVPDFPKPGVVFKDINPLLMSANGLTDVTKLFASYLRDGNVDTVIGIESRGFIFGSALSSMLRIGFVPMRKAGKLPGETIQVSYDLEYGSAALEVQAGSLKGREVVIIDDVLATGGTAAAAAELVEKAGGKVAGMLFLIELDFLKGRDLIKDYKVESILHY
jgi:adenine phosphoribosyltransferase